jgi:ribose-phosphate pyrophosphokinase
VEKFRSSGVVTGGLLAGEVRGKATVVVDDMISTGTTLIRAARACRSAGAERIFAAAAHGLFIEGAPALFAEPTLELVMTLDTIPPFRVAPDVVARRLSVLGTAGTVAQVIRECRNAG